MLGYRPYRQFDAPTSILRGPDAAGWFSIYAADLTGTTPADAWRPVVDPELADQLLARAEASGVELLRLDGLLSQITKAMLERACPRSRRVHILVVAARPRQVLTALAG